MFEERRPFQTHRHCRPISLSLLVEPLGESSRLPIGGVGECGEGSSCDQTDHTAASTLADVTYKQAVAVGTAESLAVAPPLSLPQCKPIGPVVL